MASSAEAWQPIGAAEILAAVPFLPRKALERCVEAMIEHLDDIEGDCDFEREHDVGADDFGEL